MIENSWEQFDFIKFVRNDGNGENLLTMGSKEKEMEGWGGDLIVILPITYGNRLQIWKRCKNLNADLL